MKRKNRPQKNPGQNKADCLGLSRRDFVTAGLSAFVTALASSAGNKAFAAVEEKRIKKGRAIRARAARRDYLGLGRQRTNGDEKRLGVVACYTKGLQHNALGEANSQVFKKLNKIIESERWAELDQLDIGIRPLVNPQAGKAFGLDGPDSHVVTLAPAPSFDSAEKAAELTELYWQAHVRDVNFIDYDSNSDIAAACGELSLLHRFTGPKSGGQVTPATLFRGHTAGDLPGPYISQFLFNEAPVGALRIEQKIRTTVAGDDYMTSYDSWLATQNGQLLKINPDWDPTRRFIRNGRDLAWYVYNDRAYQPFFMAASMLVDRSLVTAPLLELRLNPGNPYKRRVASEGFVTFGESHIFALLAQATWAALKATWYQKWYVHKVLRPETFAGRVHNHITGAKSYPIHSQVINSAALDRNFNLWGNYLLPQAYIEGSPMHPSYPSGHATVAGACATILKAFFDESYPYEDPVVPNAAGTALVDYSGADRHSLTLGGEINKLAANIGIGRNFAGIHYRSDYWGGLQIGEQVALRLLRQMAQVYSENHYYSLTRFDGKKITIRKRGVTYD